jgi:CBS domain-containing protein
MATSMPAERSVPPATCVRDIMTTDVLTIGVDDDLRLALQMMLWGGFRHLPVVDRDKLVGIVTEHDITRARLSRGLGPDARVGQVMTCEPITVAPGDLVRDVAARMADRSIASIPVVEEERLVGIVTTHDVLTHLGRASTPASTAGLTIRDVMCSAPRAVRSHCPLSDALPEMVSAGVRHLPIVDAEGRVIGMLSDRDVRAAVGDPVAALREETYEETLALSVNELMTENPITARPDQPLDALAWALLDERVGAVPVVDDAGILVGIVSYIDVLGAALRPKPN